MLVSLLLSRIHLQTCIFADVKYSLCILAILLMSTVHYVYLYPCCCQVSICILEYLLHDCLWLQVDASAAVRAAVQRRAPPGTEATALPGGSPIFAAVPDDVNKVLQEAVAPLQVSFAHTCHLIDSHCRSHWQDRQQAGLTHWLCSDCQDQLAGSGCSTQTGCLMFLYLSLAELDTSWCISSYWRHILAVGIQHMAAATAYIVKLTSAQLASSTYAAHCRADNVIGTKLLINTIICCLSALYAEAALICRVRDAGMQTTDYLAYGLCNCQTSCSVLSPDAVAMDSLLYHSLVQQWSLSSSDHFAVWCRYGCSRTTFISLL